MFIEILNFSGNTVAEKPMLKFNIKLYLCIKLILYGIYSSL